MEPYHPRIRVSFCQGNLMRIKYNKVSQQKYFSSFVKFVQRLNYNNKNLQNVKFYSITNILIKFYSTTNILVNIKCCVRFDDQKLSMNILLLQPSILFIGDLAYMPSYIHNIHTYLCILQQYVTRRGYIKNFTSNKNYGTEQKNIMR